MERTTEQRILAMSEEEAERLYDMEPDEFWTQFTAATRA